LSLDFFDPFDFCDDHCLDPFFFDPNLLLDPENFLFLFDFYLLYDSDLLLFLLFDYSLLLCFFFLCLFENPLHFLLFFNLFLFRFKLDLLELPILNFFFLTFLRLAYFLLAGLEFPDYLKLFFSGGSYGLFSRPDFQFISHFIGFNFGQIGPLEDVFDKRVELLLDPLLRDDFSHQGAVYDNDFVVLVELPLGVEDLRLDVLLGEAGDLLVK
jgi:hypothetical protein